MEGEIPAITDEVQFQLHLEGSESDESSPMVTMPDMEKDPVVSQIWPQNIGFYNRQKKLIRDVSGQSDKQTQNLNPLYQIKKVT